jgi:hypothetical protein
MESRVCCSARFAVASSADVVMQRAPRFPSLLLLPRAFDAKAAFVTAIDALHAIAKHDDAGSTIPHSCVICRRLVLPLRSLFAHVEESTSVMW